MSLDTKIRRFCEVDPMEFFGLPPKDSPPPIPELDLSIEPPFAEFIDFGGASKHRVTNSGSAKLVFKVKCSNNQLYKVNPVYSFLNPGASVELQILRAEGPNRNDKLIIMFKTAVKGERDPRKQFQLEGDIQKKALALITEKSILFVRYDQDSCRMDSERRTNEELVVNDAESASELLDEIRELAGFGNSMNFDKNV